MLGYHVLKPHQFDKHFLLFTKASRSMHMETMLHNIIDSLHFRKKHAVFKVITEVTENLAKVR